MLIYLGLGVASRAVSLAREALGWDIPVLANSALMFGYAHARLARRLRGLGVHRHDRRRQPAPRAAARALARARRADRSAARPTTSGRLLGEAIARPNT